MIDIRCKNCNRYLMNATIVVAALKCPRCKMIFEYKAYSNIYLVNSEDPKETKKHLQDLEKRD